MALRVALLDDVFVGDGVRVRLPEGLTMGVHRGDSAGRSHDGSTRSVSGGDATTPKHARSPRRLKPHAEVATEPEESDSSRLASGLLKLVGGITAPCGHTPTQAVLPLACKKQLWAAPSATVTMPPADEKAAGTAACPASLAPQHTGTPRTVLPSSSAHEW